MPGIRNEERSDYVTSRRFYRSLSTADEGGPQDAGVPVLDTEANPDRLSARNQHGLNAQVNLYVVINEFTSVVLELWQKAEQEGAEADLEDVPPSYPETEDWVFVETKTFTRSEAWTIKDRPPGKFKVLAVDVDGGSSSSSLSSESAGSAVHILEQHAY